MVAFVYVIGSEKGSIAKTYVGWTVDPTARLEAHNTGQGAKSTRGRTWRLLYLEKYKTRGEAMSREWRLKRDRPFRNLLRSLLESEPV